MNKECKFVSNLRNVYPINIQNKALVFKKYGFLDKIGARHIKFTIIDNKIVDFYGNKDNTIFYFKWNKKECIAKFKNPHCFEFYSNEIVLTNFLQKLIISKSGGYSIRRH